MTGLTMAVCLVAAANMALGQIFLKIVAEQYSGGKPPLRVVFSKWMAAAVFAYGLNVVLWIWVLTKTPLALAYPFALLGAALVPVVAAWAFKEKLGGRFFLGFALILLGLLITQTS